MDERDVDRQRKRYKTRVTWSPRSENLLLGLWKQRLPDLNGPTKNIIIFQQMSTKLYKDYNVSISANEIKMKINNLTTKYKKEKRLFQRNNAYSSTWDLYPQVHAIIGDQKTERIEDSVADTFNELLMETESSSPQQSQPNSPTPSNGSSFEWPSFADEKTIEEIRESEKNSDRNNSIDGVKRAYKKRKMWSRDEESVLLEVWRENLEDLSGGKRKRAEIYQDMEKIMKSENVVASAYEIRMKIINLTSKYRSEKCTEAKTGIPSSWPYFKRIDSLMRRRKMVTEARQELDFTTSDGGATNQYVYDTSDPSSDEESVAGNSLEPVFDEEVPISYPSQMAPHKLKVESRATLPNTSSTSPALRASSPGSSMLHASKRSRLKSDVRSEGKRAGSYSELVHEFRNCAAKFDECLRKMKETDESLLSLETKKVHLLEIQTRDGTELKNALLSYLRDH